VKGLNDYSIRIEVPEGKLKELLDRISDAQKVIYDCYSELEALGIVTIVPNKITT